jgi:hypothetical protein
MLEKADAAEMPEKADAEMAEKADVAVEKGDALETLASNLEARYILLAIERWSSWLLPAHTNPLHPQDFRRRSIVKFPYLLYVTIIGVILPVVVCCINADTTVLVGALFILGDRVECIPIYLVPLESQYSRRW